MKFQEQFGDRFDSDSPWDWDFGGEDDDFPLMFPEDTETVYCLIHKARAEVIAVSDDREDLKEFGKNIGVWRESGLYAAPFGLDPGEMGYPDPDGSANDTPAKERDGY